MLSSRYSSDSPQRLAKRRNGVILIGRTALFSLFIAVLSTLSLLGQERFGSFLGTVTDPSGA
ncbi:MAG: hypothetical protein ACJ74Y_05125, partial [Bryobacteraceae bacterium]